MKYVHFTKWFFLVGVYLLTNGCQNKDQPTSVAKPTVSSRDLEILYAGCLEVLRGPVCVLPDDRTLTVWARSSSKTELRWNRGVEREIIKPRLVDGGFQFQIIVEHGAHAVQLGRAHESESPVWSLSVVQPSEQPILAKAKRERSAGNTDEAERILMAALSSLPVGARARAKSLLARILLHRGQTEQSLRLFAEAIAEHRSVGQISEAISDISAQVFTLLNEGRHFSEARRSLSIKDETQGFAPCVFALAYGRALLARDLDDLGQALDEAERGLRTTIKTGLTDDQWIVTQLKGTILLALGRRQEAIELYKHQISQLSPTSSNNERMISNGNLGWAILTALEAGEKPALSPTQFLTEAARLSEQENAPHRIERNKGRVNAQISFALTAFYEGRLSDAQTYIDAARALGAKRDPIYELWCLDIEARLLAARKKYDLAATRYRMMEELALSSIAHDAIFRAITGRAAILAKAGRRKEALAEYARAEELLDQAALRVGINDGRATFLAQRDQAAKEYLSLLLDTGSIDTALRLVRRRHQRLLRSEIVSQQLAISSPNAAHRWEEAIAAYRRARAEIDAAAKEDWRLSKPELISLRAARVEIERSLIHQLSQAYLAIAGNNANLSGELRSLRDNTLLAFARESRGFVALLGKTEGTFVAREPADRATSFHEEIAVRLLTTLETKLFASKKIMILANDQTRSINVHALQIKEEALISKVPVVYTLDLPGSGSPNQSAIEARRAVVVIDPEGNLSSARQEGIHIMKALSTKGYQPVALYGPDVSRTSLVDGMKGAALFHYAGHAQPDSQRGWGSALRLSGSASFTPADVLSLGSAPLVSVLLGCGTGIALGESGAVMGVTQALLVAGGEMVIATSRELSDSTAARFSKLFYQHFDRLDSAENASQRATINLMKTDSDWGIFRIYTR